MAKTSEQVIDIRNPGPLMAFPVASGETIYKGTFAGVVGGYLYNLDSANVNSSTIIVLVADGSANTSGPAATTANGSISGTLEEASAVAGDKTVRNCYVSGEVRLTGSGFAQDSVGKTCYLTDNYAAQITGPGAKAGTITKYISSTTVWVDLNTSYSTDGVITARLPITAATTSTGGDAISWTPGVVAYLQNIDVDVTTPATGSATMDIGVAANGTTSSDTLIDGIDVGSAAIYGNPYVNGGTNGEAPRKLTATQYVTGTPSATLAGLVGTVVISYIKA
jgi:hypothetical protein